MQLNEQSRFAHSTKNLESNGSCKRKLFQDVGGFFELMYLGYLSRIESVPDDLGERIVGSYQLHKTRTKYFVLRTQINDPFLDLLKGVGPAKSKFNPIVVCLRVFCRFREH